MLVVFTPLYFLFFYCFSTLLTEKLFPRCHSKVYQCLAQEIVPGTDTFFFGQLHWFNPFCQKSKWNAVPNYYRADSCVYLTDTFPLSAVTFQPQNLTPAIMSWRPLWPQYNHIFLLTFHHSRNLGRGPRHQVLTEIDQTGCFQLFFSGTPYIYIFPVQTTTDTVLVTGY